MTRRVLLAGLLLAMCLSIGTAWAGVTYDTVRAWDTLYIGSARDITSTVKIDKTTGAHFERTMAAGQTTESNSVRVDLTTDSTFIGGTDITYSGGYGSAAIDVSGTYSGVNGAYVGVISLIASSGAHTAAGAGTMAMKGVTTNTAALADGNIYGGMFWAKHNHATNVMTASAALIGLEGMAYNAGLGPARTVIGGNFGYHNEGTVAKGNGSVFRGIQVVLDDASGATQADETSGICLWNMAGTQTGAVRVVESDGGFGSLFDFPAVGTCIVADTDTVPATSTHKILIRVGSTTYYIPVHSTW